MDRLKNALASRPVDWKSSNVNFGAMRKKFKLWGCRLTDNFNKMLDKVEIGEELTAYPMEFFNGLIEDADTFRAVDKEFHYALHASTVDALFLTFIENEQQSGFVAWRRLAGRFSPRHGIDQDAEYIRVITPQSWIKIPKSVDYALETLIEWESAVAVYELSLIHI